MKALEERRKDLLAPFSCMEENDALPRLWLSKAAEGPERVFLLEEGREFTYGEVLGEADRISAALWSMGLTKGGCVARCPE